MLVKTLFSGLVGASVILLCYGLGLVVSDTLNSAVPGAVCGLLLLLLLLFIAPSVKVSVSIAARPILSHMSLFFVPAVMGVGAYWTVIEANLSGLVMAIVVTTCIALAVQAKLTQWLIHSSEGQDKPREPEER